MEVACVGRTFASRVAKLARERSDFAAGDATQIAWIMQSACLVHDLGNPPFGHAGEEVVRAWAAKHADEMFDVNRFNSPAEHAASLADWLHFEGNAQGFRLAARRDIAKVSYLNLTHASLAAAIKYPWSSADPRTAERNKHNIYSTELPLFRAMAEDLGLVLPSGQICRHPLSFLTEAADDICYRIIDLEDAVEMGIRDEASVHRLFLAIAAEHGKESMRLPQLRGLAITSLIETFWKVFEESFDQIMNGERLTDLKSSLDATTKEHIAAIKANYDEIFGHSKKVAMELGAYHILGRVLKALMKTINALHDAETYAEVPFLSRRCAELVWGRDFAEKNFEQGHAWWLSRVSDFVSGMTDDYATKLSGDIGGHSFFDR